MSLPKIVHTSQFVVRRFKKRTINRNSTGFTLIELLVVISIIAILIAVATVSYTNAQQKGRDNKRKSDLKAVQQALEIYFQQNAKYPTGTGGAIVCNNGDTSTHAWGSAFTCNLVTYMNPLPKDPITTTSTNYNYVSNSPFSTYQLFAKIENGKDQDLINTTQSNCNGLSNTAYQTAPSNNYYCVINP